ncbi:hypothetical protein FOZ63_005110 [Perkinsus olseni]|uniref:Uncharacterized protein n=1 Tax=Perkinsus olseni TaxID=32597 RepID=A0A7J6R4T4_PEROL|nr:hypothetical protein FOZ63_005110 [Perkinsus olseni]KAF4746664.1 hypothetical protein FOZ62_001689 [Perkinsus olseni]
MAPSTCFGYRVAFGTEFTVHYNVNSNEVPWERHMLEHIKTAWPALAGTDFSVVYQDEKGRSCNILTTQTRPLFAMAGREFKLPNGGTEYLLLDLTVVPGPTGPIHAVAEEPEEQQGDESVQVGTTQVVSRPPQYRYQLTFNEQCFVSKSYDTIDFSLEKIREDVEKVWPHLAPNSLQCFICKDKAGRSWEVTEESSMSGLFDCFAEETVRSDGHTVLILKLEVGLEGLNNTSGRAEEMEASIDRVPTTSPPSMRGDQQEPPVRGSSDAEHSGGPGSDSWILPATTKK